MKGSIWLSQENLSHVERTRHAKKSMLSYLNSTSFSATSAVHSFLPIPTKTIRCLQLRKKDYLHLHSPGFMFHFMTSRVVEMPFRSAVSFRSFSRCIKVTAPLRLVRLWPQSLQNSQSHCRTISREHKINKMQCPVRHVCMALYGSCESCGTIGIYNSV